MPQVFTLLFFSFLDIFCNLDPFEVLSNNPNIDSFQWLREDVHWIIDQVFKEKFMV